MLKRAAAFKLFREVIKSRIMGSRSGQKYRNVYDCILQTLKQDGPFAFFRGFLPAYLRLGPHTIISFVLVRCNMSVRDEGQLCTPVHVT